MTVETNGVLAAPLATHADRFRLEVCVTDTDGASASDIIEFGNDRARRASTGSDSGTIGAWPERHLFGTQLGPNRNGRKW